jgi:trans-aconitate 2-methyltransferase
MMNKNDWNPELYLKFGRERIQPSIDLVNRIHFTNPRKIIDIGCGPGNSTQILVQKWPDAEITGVDNSSAMIERAKKDYPEQNWRLLDAGNDEIEGNYDIIFSNATIQWIPDHSGLIRKFYNLLSDKGVIAIQIPLFWDMPVGKAIRKIAAANRWISITRGVSNLFTIHDYSFYYDILSDLGLSTDIWETDYFHILDSHLSIREMIRSTGLRPYLDRLETKADKQVFEETVLKEIDKDYPLQKDGKVLFPFKRLFFIAYKYYG